MTIPQDEYPTQIEPLIRAMDEAASVLEHACLTIDNLLARLDEARDEVVIEQYGAAFMEEIESLAAKHNAGENRR